MEQFIEIKPVEKIEPQDIEEQIFQAGVRIQYDDLIEAASVNCPFVPRDYLRRQIAAAVLLYLFRLQQLGIHHIVLDKTNGKMPEEIHVEDGYRPDLSELILPCRLLNVEFAAELDQFLTEREAVIGKERLSAIQAGARRAAMEVVVPVSAGRRWFLDEGFETVDPDGTVREEFGRMLDQNAEALYAAGIRVCEIQTDGDYIEGEKAVFNPGHFNRKGIERFIEVCRFMHSLASGEQTFCVSRKSCKLSIDQLRDTASHVIGSRFDFLASNIRHLTFSDSYGFGSRGNNAGLFLELDAGAAGKCEVLNSLDNVMMAEMIQALTRALGARGIDVGGVPFVVTFSGSGGKEKGIEVKLSKTDEHAVRLLVAAGGAIGDAISAVISSGTPRVETVTAAAINDVKTKSCAAGEQIAEALAYIDGLNKPAVRSKPKSKNTVSGPELADDPRFAEIDADGEKKKQLEAILRRHARAIAAFGILGIKLDESAANANASFCRDHVIYLAQPDYQRDLYCLKSFFEGLDFLISWREHGIEPYSTLDEFYLNSFKHCVCDLQGRRYNSIGPEAFKKAGIKGILFCSTTGLSDDVSLLAFNVGYYDFLMQYSGSYAGQDCIVDYALFHKTEKAKTHAELDRLRIVVGLVGGLGQDKVSIQQELPAAAMICPAALAEYDQQFWSSEERQRAVERFGRRGLRAVFENIGAGLKAGGRRQIAELVLCLTKHNLELEDLHIEPAADDAGGRVFHAIAADGQYRFSIIVDHLGRSIVQPMDRREDDGKWMPLDCEKRIDVFGLRYLARAVGRRMRNI